MSGEKTCPTAACPICFEELAGKIKASPDVCDHQFCLPCLEKWSKLGSFCPVDRKRYKKIVNLESESIIQIKSRKRRRVKPVYDISTKCEICSEDNCSEVLLLCDCCDLAYHLFCLSPPLENIPAGLWYCPSCIAIEERLKKKKGITKETEADMGNALLNSKALIDAERNTTASKQDSQGQTDKDISKFQNENFIGIKPCNVVLEACSTISVPSLNLNTEKDICPSVSSSNSWKDSDYYTSETESCSSEISNNARKIHSQKKRETSKVNNLKKLYSENIKTKKSCLKNKTPDNVLLMDEYFSQNVNKEMSTNHNYLFRDHESESRTKEFHCNEDKDSYYLRKRISPIKKQSYFLRHSASSEKHYASFVSDEDSSSSLENFYHRPVKTVSNEFERNAKSVNTSKPEDHLPTGSTVPSVSDKGTFNSLISHDSAQNGFQKPLSEIIMNNNSERQQEGPIQFSVFEKIENKDALQKKYSEINSMVKASFSSNLNVKHCFSCKVMIPSASQKYCKICKLENYKKYMSNEKNLKFACSSRQSQILACSNSSNNTNKFLKLNNQKSTNKNKKFQNSFDRRYYYFLCKIQKIRNSNCKINEF